MSVYLDYLIEKYEDNPDDSSLFDVPSNSGTVDANQYTASLPAIKNLLLDKNTSSERLGAIGSVSVATMVPIIAVIMIVSDIYGPSDELDKMLLRMMKFYRIGLASYKGREAVYSL